MSFRVLRFQIERSLTSNHLGNADTLLYELTAELGAIRDDIDEWKNEYDVESADGLRATVGDDIPASERQQRQHDAEDWEYYEHRAMLIQQAIQLHDTIEATRESRLAAAS